MTQHPYATQWRDGQNHEFTEAEIAARFAPFRDAMNRLAGRLEAYTEILEDQGDAEISEAIVNEAAAAAELAFQQYEACDAALTSLHFEEDGDGADLHELRDILYDLWQEIDNAANLLEGLR